MNKAWKFKFKMGEEVLVKSSGEQSNITGRRRGVITLKNYYKLNISDPNLWFCEHNIKAVENGFDAEDIISKAFGLDMGA